MKNFFKALLFKLKAKQLAFRCLLKGKQREEIKGGNMRGETRPPPKTTYTKYI